MKKPLFVVFVLVISCLAVCVHGQPCDGCKDATYSPGCPEPAFCGFSPIICVNCSAGISSPSCTNPVWCANYTCSDMCMDEMPMPGCPDPGACGFKPIKCVGCVPSLSTASCPKPVWCGNFSTGTPPCYECMADMAMPGCPDPGVCGLPPLCQDCMAGMSMPNCPRPDACLSQECVMNMFFGTSSNICLFFSSWRVSNAGQWTLAVFVILLLCFLREFSAAYRHHRSLQRKHQRQRNKAMTSGLRTPLLREAHGSESNEDSSLWTTAYDSIYYTISVTLSYLVMLLIMTYNVAVCLLVVLGCGLSHFVLALLFSKYYRRLRQQYAAAQVSLAVTPGSALEGGASSSSSSSSASSPSAPPAPGSATADMSGDHCCEGVEFDD